MGPPAHSTCPIMTCRPGSANAKRQNIQETGANLVMTGCPSCIMQIEHVLRLEQEPVQVMHLAELLSMSYGSTLAGEATDSEEWEVSLDGSTRVGGSQA